MSDSNSATNSVIVIGGHAPDARAIPFLPLHATIICADSGLDHALALGLEPDVVIGDMDSVNADNLALAGTNNWIVIPHPIDKDQTDTELALAYAVSRGCTTITLLWGGGDRIDHVLGVMAALADSSLSLLTSLTAWIGSDKVIILHDHHSSQIINCQGFTLSLIPLSGSSATITTHGLTWELHAEMLTSTTARGLSNIIARSACDISSRDGVIAVVLPGYLEQTGKQ